MEKGKINKASINCGIISKLELDLEEKMWGNIWKNRHNFLSKTKDTNLHIREAKCIPKQMRCINTNKTTSHPRYIIVKVLKPKIKRKTWKQPEVKESVFSLEQRPDTVKWSVKMLKGVRDSKSQNSLHSSNILH